MSHFSTTAHLIPSGRRNYQGNQYSSLGKECTAISLKESRFTTPLSASMRIQLPMPNLKIQVLRSHQNSLRSRMNGEHVCGIIFETLQAF